jgi:signal transduction histidine kinase
VALDLHRADRSIAVLRAAAGRELDAEALELLEVAGEMITSTIVAGRSIEQQQEAVHRLESLDELKTTFLGVASHELRTPATAISGLATLLASRWDALSEDDRRAFASRIATNADALNALVQDLLDFARLERGDLELALAPVELSDTVDRVLTRLDGVWGSHGVVRAIQPGLVVLGDVNAIERIVTNLISNAVKFSPTDADVSVTVEADDGRARLLVDDSGPGVPEGERDKIFVRFFRGAGDAVVRTRGVGIGLSVVQDFVAQMGGTVRVEDSPLGGARFVVELDALDRSRVEERDAATT